jgi:branched-chain amino acid transport system substrate-binding protein
MNRYLRLTVTALALAAPCLVRAEPTGVTKDEIRIGQTTSYSGPASQYGQIGKVQSAFFQMLNEKGGINSRKIKFISLDDAYSPPKSVEQVRKLVEQDEVAFMFNSFGGPTNAAQAKYLNRLGIPQLFVGTGADYWGDVKTNPGVWGAAELSHGGSDLRQSRRREKSRRQDCCSVSKR